MSDSDALTVMGYAVVRTDGTFVGIWRELDIAEKIVNRGRQSKDERVVPMFSLSNNAAPQATVSPRGASGSNSVNDPSPAGGAPDPFNCPKCGAHDFGLNRPTCPHCGFHEFSPPRAQELEGELSAWRAHGKVLGFKAGKVLDVWHVFQDDSAQQGAAVEGNDVFIRRMGYWMERAQAAESQCKELEEALRDLYEHAQLPHHVNEKYGAALKRAQALLAAREEVLGIESQSRRGKGK